MLFFIVSILEMRKKKGFYKQISMIFFIVFLAWLISQWSEIGPTTDDSINCSRQPSLCKILFE